MRRPCFMVRHWRMALGLVLVPPCLWLLLLALLPTSYARNKIAAHLSASSGRVVKIGALKVGFFGGIHLEDLKIGAPTTGDDPWLKVRGATIDMHLFRLFFGPIEATQIDVDGVELRILRRADATMELADFLHPANRETDPNLDERHGNHNVNLSLQNAKITIIDLPTATRMTFDRVEGGVTCDGVVTTMTDLHGTLNDGTIQLAGRFDRSGSVPRFEGQVRARDVAIGEGMGALSYFLPLLPTGVGSSGKGFEGRLGLDFYLEGEGRTRDALRKSLVGTGRIDVDPIALEGSTLLNNLAKLLQVPNRERFGSARADLALKNGRMTSDNLTLSVANLPMVFNGWTDLDGRINYRLKAEGIRDKIPQDAIDYLSGLDIKLDVKGLTDLEVQGTVDDPQVLLDGLPLVDAKANGGSPANDAERLREIGRKLRDRVRR